jgi:hypothetical protein
MESDHTQYLKNKGALTHHVWYNHTFEKELLKFVCMYRFI